MAFIPEKDIQAIKEKADIVQIISQYESLEKSGKEYVGLCPFHEDHSPSMRVSPQKQIFKCFSCGAGGDVFSYVSRREGISWPEAVAKVAGQVNYPLSTTVLPARKEDPSQPLYDLLELFDQYCIYELHSQDGDEAMKYLKSRQFSDALLEKFSIGYAPDYKMVASWLDSRNIDSRLMEQTGLIRIGAGKTEPYFHSRIMIPIHDPFGNPVGFTARILPGSNNPAKYVNTTATPIFEKGNLIFNYHRARKSCRKSGRLILVEGAMDVLGLEKAGIEEGIACLGTAVTDHQIGLIASLKTPVTVFYDQDAAGKKAAWNFGQKALNAGIPFSVVMQDDAKDADEIFCSKGADALRRVVSQTVPFAEFAMDYLQSQYNLQNYEDKKAYSKVMQDLIARSMEPYEQAGMLARLEGLTGFTFQNGKGTKKRIPKTNDKSILLPQVPKGRLQAEKEVLWSMLREPEYAWQFQQENGFFSDETCRLLSLYINQAWKTNEEIDPVALLEVIEEQEAKDLLLELCDWPDHSASLETHFWQSLTKIKTDTLEKQIAGLQDEIKGESDPNKKIKLMMQMRDLVNMKLQLQSGKGTNT